MHQWGLNGGMVDVEIYFFIYEIPKKIQVILDARSQKFHLKLETLWINGNTQRKLHSGIHMQFNL